MLISRMAVAVVAVITIAASSAVNGQSFPTKPLRILASDAGGNTDFAARIVAQGIGGALGQPVIVENMPSALLADSLLKATPDGYTTAFAGGVVWLTPLTQKTSYDPVKDFLPVTWAVTYPYVLIVHPSLPTASLKDLIALAKSKPGVLNIGATASPGGESFLAAELFKSMAGVNMVRVPYKSNVAAQIAVISGESQLMFIAPGAAIPNVKSGKLKALAVTSLESSPLAPGLPTMAAAGLPGYECLTIIGVLAPANTPTAIVNRLNQEILRILPRTDAKEKFLTNSMDIIGSSPEQFGAKIRSEIAKWGKVLKDAGIKPEL